MFRHEMSEFRLGGAARGPKPSHRPAVEALEERVVPVLFGLDHVVVGAVNSAVGSLHSGGRARSSHGRLSAGVSGLKGIRSITRAQERLHIKLNQQADQLINYAIKLSNKNLDLTSVLTDPDVAAARQVFEELKKTLQAESGLNGLMKRELIHYPTARGAAQKFLRRHKDFKLAAGFAQLAEQMFAEATQAAKQKLPQELQGLADLF